MSLSVFGVGRNTNPVNLRPATPAKVQFGATTPDAKTPYWKKVEIQYQNEKVDIFQPFIKNDEARIVLLPTENKGSVVPDLQTLDQEALPRVWKGVQGLLSAIMSGKTKDEQGNLLAVFKSKDSESRKAAAQTLKAMADAFEAQLDSLPNSVEKVTLVLPEKLPSGLKHQEVARRLTEQAVLNSYNPYTFRDEPHPSKLKSVSLTRSGSTAFNTTKSIKEGTILGNAQNFARYLVDSPANIKTTQWVGEQAKSLETASLKVEVRDKQWIESGNGKRMGLFLSVAQGNDPDSFARQPRLIEMVYTPKDGKYDKTILLAGKGIIFDTGGNNLKASEFIHNMHGDMAGAAAVMGAMKALDDLQIPGVRVIGVSPMTENRLGSGATLPQDIYTARNGKKVEIDNTDAEGRLVLADAMDYGLETYKPDAVVDIATLTGGKVRGLGAQNCIAIMGNNPELAKKMDGISKSLGRTTAVLPITQEHIKWVTRGGLGKAHAYNSVGMADAKHFGVIKEDFNRENKAHSLAHSAQGGAFLMWSLMNGNGNAKTPAVHLDIAGAEFAARDPKKGNAEYATGFGVSELVEFVKGVSSGDIVPDAAKSTLTNP